MVVHPHLLVRVPPGRDQEGLDPRLGQGGEGLADPDGSGVVRTGPRDALDEQLLVGHALGVEDGAHLGPQRLGGGTLGTGPGLELVHGGGGVDREGRGDLLGHVGAHAGLTREQHDTRAVRLHQAHHLLGDLARVRVPGVLGRLLVAPVRPAAARDLVQVVGLALDVAHLGLAVPSVVRRDVGALAVDDRQHEGQSVGGLGRPVGQVGEEAVGGDREVLLACGAQVVHEHLAPADDDGPLPGPDSVGVGEQPIPGGRDVLGRCTLGVELLDERLPADLDVVGGVLGVPRDVASHGGERTLGVEHRADLVELHGSAPSVGEVSPLPVPDPPAPHAHERVRPFAATWRKRARHAGGLASRPRSRGRKAPRATAEGAPP